MRALGTRTPVHGGNDSSIGSKARPFRIRLGSPAAGSCREPDDKCHREMTTLPSGRHPPPSGDSGGWPLGFRLSSRVRRGRITHIMLHVSVIFHTDPPSICHTPCSLV